MDYQNNALPPVAQSATDTVTETNIILLNSLECLRSVLDDLRGSQPSAVSGAPASGGRPNLASMLVTNNALARGIGEMALELQARIGSSAKQEPGYNTLPNDMRGYAGVLGGMASGRIG